MGDLILGIILEILGEALFEVVVAGIADLASRAIRGIFDLSEVTHPAAAWLGYLLLGLLMGGATLIPFPDRIVHRSRMPGMSLVVTPVIVGLLMSATRFMLLRRGKKVIQLESFGYGFAFALGMTLIRLLLAK